MTIVRIEDCGPALAALSGEDARRLLRHLRSRGLLLGRVRDLHASCVRARLCQADLVLALLRLEVLDAVERLMGHPITRCPSMLAGARGPRPVRRERREGDLRRVARVTQPQAVERGRRRLLRCRMYERLSQARAGMTIETLLARGVTRKDLRIATRRGYLEMES